MGLVPPEVCLLSCVFYITDYQKYVDIAQLDVWKKVFLTLTSLIVIVIVVIVI